MKRIKNYIDAELAKKKLARYRYWAIKDENGITICSCEDNNPENKGFGEVLDSIIADNVDAEVQVKYGTNEQSSRQNPPFFIKVNDAIEWVDPEEETVQINGVPHKVDRNGNVNINLTAPALHQEEGRAKDHTIEPVQIDTFRQEMEFQLQGLKQEYALKEEKWQLDLQNKLLEQTLKFKEMMLQEREARISEREQSLQQKEMELEEKQQELQDDVKGYLKQVPTVLGGLVKEWIKAGTRKQERTLAGPKEQLPRKRRPVQFQVEPDDLPEQEEEDEDWEEEPEDEELEEQEEEEITESPEEKEPKENEDADLQSNHTRES